MSNEQARKRSSLAEYFLRSPKPTTAAGAREDEKGPKIQVQIGDDEPWPSTTAKVSKSNEQQIDTKANNRAALPSFDQLQLEILFNDDYSIPTDERRRRLIQLRRMRQLLKVMMEQENSTTIIVGSNNCAILDSFS